ncbi:hypothetical protein H0A66_15420 [Alcaligenaceae bacterium]|nr:hypothetical protein [Alcaligenaceae bacterium]
MSDYAARARGIAWQTMQDMALGLPRALWRRKVISPAVEKIQPLPYMATINVARH